VRCSRRGRTTSPPASASRSSSPPSAPGRTAVSWRRPGSSPAETLRAAGLEPGDLETAPAPPAGWGFAEPARPGAELIAASAADVLVESTVQEKGGAATAVAHVEQALAGGMHVLSVNKGPIAWDYRRLADLAAARGRRLLFEGVTMDGCPVYNLAERCLPGARVLGVSGVLNSTTNYLLDAMAEGRAFAEALAWVQAEGFAEADPPTTSTASTRPARRPRWPTC
jgi:homoserine dehydrogenase